MSPSSSKAFKPLIQLSIVNQHRTADQLSTHMIGIMFGCWNARGMNPQAEHVHNTLSSLKGYNSRTKKNNKS